MEDIQVNPVTNDLCALLDFDELLSWGFKSRDFVGSQQSWFHVLYDHVDQLANGKVHA